jgi:hypothetical protein
MYFGYEERLLQCILMLLSQVDPTTSSFLTALWWRLVEELGGTEPLYFTFVSVWLKRYRMEWFHEEEYSLKMLNHSAWKITSDLSARFLYWRAALLSFSLHTQVVPRWVFVWFLDLASHRPKSSRRPPAEVVGPSLPALLRRWSRFLTPTSIAGAHRGYAPPIGA